MINVVMRDIYSISIIALLVIVAGCKQLSNQNDDLIRVDVTRTNFPKKELILQDFMDVEYIVLETNDDFLNQGFVQDIGKEFIIVRNYINDGDIFVYDRTGKALRKINRRGQGGEEYTHISEITLDEMNGEIFVHDYFIRKSIVYDLYGNFKRSLDYKENTELFYTNIFNYDNDNLIGYDEFNEEVSFVLISKQDGSITQEIKIPFKEKKLVMHLNEAGTGSVTLGPYRTIIPFKGDWLLLELSSDTIYTLLPDFSLQPFMARTPSVHSMNPEVFLLLRLLSDQYIFMETVKNEYDFDRDRGFPITSFLMYDRQERAIMGYNVYNSDYTSKQEIYMNRLRPVNHEIESWQALEAFQLVEDYEKGILTGRLKEIASTLDAEDNPVIMLIKHKQ
jgi:hypothetical protein